MLVYDVLLIYEGFLIVLVVPRKIPSPEPLGNEQRQKPKNSKVPSDMNEITIVLDRLGDVSIFRFLDNVMVPQLPTRLSFEESPENSSMFGSNRT